jgi:hypothetical protein
LIDCAACIADTVLTCRDHIGNYAAIYAQIHQNELSVGKRGMTLVGLYQELATKADDTFGRILARQSECNRVRRRLEVLERHQSLFNLPIAMRKAIEAVHFASFNNATAIVTA